MPEEGKYVRIHIVQKGDTLWKIANKYGVNFEELKKMNAQLSSPEAIMPGMKIKIPGTAGTVKKESVHKPHAGHKEMPKAEHHIKHHKEAPLPVAHPPKEIIKEIHHHKKEHPKMIYQPIMPQPQPEIDINNYYMMNMQQSQAQVQQAKEMPKEIEVPVPMPIPVQQPVYQNYCYPMMPVCDPCYPMPAMSGCDPCYPYPQQMYPQVQGAMGYQPYMPMQQMPMQTMPAMMPGMLAPGYGSPQHHWEEESSSSSSVMGMHHGAGPYGPGAVLPAQNVQYPQYGSPMQGWPSQPYGMAPAGEMPAGAPGYPAAGAGDCGCGSGAPAGGYYNPAQMMPAYGRQPMMNPYQPIPYAQPVPYQNPMTGMEQGYAAMPTRNEPEEENENKNE